MSNVFVHVGMSLDGFIAGPNRAPKNPLGDHGLSLHEWMFATKTFQQKLGTGTDGVTGPDDDLVSGTFDRIGANIMGKRMFEEGEANWPELAPFRCPVFVLTHEKREPWVRPGGTTFFFVEESIDSTLAQAREAAGDKDVRISGGAHVIRQYLSAGLVDELLISLVPVLMHEGLRLFERLDPKVALEQTESIAGTGVTHLRYAVWRG